mmetsp:Transcript_39668/g.86464  ORF Transcript_39668/g.86464 Transcript_39668/m.86464 type:complete len:106 (+) Transcript_39668:833-1150(+)
MTCPVKSLSFTPFSSIWTECTVDPFFTEAKTFNLGFATVYMTGFQAHSFSYIFMASIIAPFGGFFASGMKRAFKIKDFGDDFPGHGGFTDRFDCQIVVLTFSFIY